MKKCLYNPKIGCHAEKRDKHDCLICILSAMHNEIFNLIDLLGVTKIEMQKAFNLYCSFSRLREDDDRFHTWIEKHHPEILEQLPIVKLIKLKTDLFGENKEAKNYVS